MSETTQNWISIAERLPRKIGGDKVKINDGTEVNVCYARIMSGQKIWVVYDPCIITHWLEVCN